MTADATALVALLAYMGVVVLSIPLALVSFVLGERRRSFVVALGQAALAVGALGLLAALAMLTVLPPVTVALVVGVGLLEAVVLVGVPLFVSRRLLARWTGTGADEALAFATLGLPGALVASALVFFGPAGARRYGITSLSGPDAAFAWTAFVLVVTLGPAVVGLGIRRLLDWVA
ncbi:MAG: hypothetical protein ABEJ85_02520 [Haloarculaceae archaeon]